MILGAVSITAGLLISDFYFHDYISNIPVINTYVDYIHSGYNYIISFFTDNNPKDINPEAITRSSSLESSSTVVPERVLTPSPRLPNNIGLSEDIGILSPPTTPEPPIPAALPPRRGGAGVIELF